MTTTDDGHEVCRRCFSYPVGRTRSEGRSRPLMRAHAGSLAYHPATSQWMAVRFGAAVPPGRSVSFASTRVYPRASERTLPWQAAGPAGARGPTISVTTQISLSVTPTALSSSLLSFGFRHADRVLRTRRHRTAPSRRGTNESGRLRSRGIEREGVGSRWRSPPSRDRDRPAPGRAEYGADARAGDHPVTHRPITHRPTGAPVQRSADSGAGPPSPAPLRSYRAHTHLVKPRPGCGQPRIILHRKN